MYVHIQDVQPLIEAMDLEHAFMHILDDLSGHLEEFGEERGEEEQDDAELVSRRSACTYCMRLS